MVVSLKCPSGAKIPAAVAVSPHQLLWLLPPWQMLLVGGGAISVSPLNECWHPALPPTPSPVVLMYLSGDWGSSPIP